MPGFNDTQMSRHGSSDGRVTVNYTLSRRCSSRGPTATPERAGRLRLRRPVNPVVATRRTSAWRDFPLLLPGRRRRQPGYYA